jgi:hypothetical protein
MEGAMILQSTPKPLATESICNHFKARGLFITIRFFSLAIALSLFIGGSSRAETQTVSSEFQPRPLFDNPLLLSQGPASFILSLAAEPAGSPTHEPFHLIETFHLSSLFQKVASEEDLESDSSVTLFRRPVASRFAYHSWAGFRTGYGPCLSTIAMDTFARSRTNGAGVQDPDFLYIKWSVRF